jgi:hypothetical protein
MTEESRNRAQKLIDFLIQQSPEEYTSEELSVVLSGPSTSAITSRQRDFVTVALNEYGDDLTPLGYELQIESVPVTPKRRLRRYSLIPHSEERGQPEDLT